MARNMFDRPGVRVALFAIAILSGYLVAKAWPQRPDPIVVTVQPAEAPSVRSGRGGALTPAPPTAAQGRGVAVLCSLQAPDPTWVCQNGYWQPPDAATASSNGGGGAGRASGCVTAQPGNAFSCRNGVWVMTGIDLAPGASTPDSTTTPNSPPSSPSTLPSSAEPSSSTPAATSTPSASTSTPSTSTPCTAPRPVVASTQTVECVSGTWIVR